jgi:hypothetical protein
MRGSPVAVAALGTTVAALSLLLLAAACCACLFRARAESGDASHGAAAPPNRVPTRLRLQLKPTPYERLGAAGVYIKSSAARAALSLQAAIAPAADRGLQALCGCQPQQAALPLPGANGAASSAAPLALAAPRVVGRGSARVSSGPADCAGGGLAPAVMPESDSPAAGEGCSLAPESSGPAVTPSPSAASAPGVEPSVHGAACAICLSSFTAASIASVLPCGHVLHSECVLPWLARSRFCPVCRADVVAGIVALGAAAATLPPADGSCFARPQMHVR